MIKHPDAPMLVTDTRINAIRVSVWNKSAHELIDYGWIDPATCVGWTLSKFDWDTAESP